MSNQIPVTKKWSKKGNCPNCNVSTGSRHSKDCVYNPKTDLYTVKRVYLDGWQIKYLLHLLDGEGADLMELEQDQYTKIALQMIDSITDELEKHNNGTIKI